MKLRATLAPGVAALLCASVIAGCSSSGGSHPATGPTPAAPTSATTAATGSGTTHVVTQRTGQVVVYLPKRHGTVGVVVLHSYSHSPKVLVAEGWNAEADQYGFVAIYPTRGADWNAGLCCGRSVKAKRDDVGWLTEQIRMAQSTYHLTTIYLAGESNGAMMVERLLAQVPSITSRFAIWAGSPEYGTTSTWAGAGYLFHGTNDREVPINGGTVRIGGQLIRINPTSQTSRLFPHAHLTFVTLPGLGHGAPTGWPDLAWHALADIGASATPNG